VRLEGLCQLKNPVTSSGIEPATPGLYHSASTNYVAAGGIMRSDRKEGGVNRNTWIKG
jgi:hypothetical protein